MNWTPDQLTHKGYKLNNDGSYSQTHKTNPARLPNPVTKHPAQQTLESLPERKKTGSKITRIRITRYSTRPLDCDNFAGGCKPIIDQLRYAKLITDDSPEDVEIQFSQVKVKTKEKQRTEIEINY